MDTLNVAKSLALKLAAERNRLELKAVLSEAERRHLHTLGEVLQMVKENNKEARQ
jgi:hypothetical protein